MVAERTTARPRAIDVGNAGEALVLAHLLAKGFHAAHTARNSPAFDILARKGDHYVALRVKSSRSHAVRYSARPYGSVFLDLRRGDRTDFVVFVLMTKHRLEGAEFYVVPTVDVNKALRINNAKFLRKGGKENSIRRLRFAGDPKNQAAGYDKRWMQYRGAWHLLEGKVAAANALTDSWES